ncbi:MAG: hypothetical protein GY936_20680 [Ignavibacteriae bacterium]|nr:hypothetical protein [Ignavibacteriota bacterium]
MKKSFILLFLLSFHFPYVLSQQIDIKVYLEGGYNSGALSTALNDNNALPFTQPYNIEPWNYNGTENVAEIPQNIVDWVLVKLRTSKTEQVGDLSRAGFLRQDGKIVDLDGTSNLDFAGLTTNDYYVAVYHRNHLPVMSATKIRINQTTAGNISGRIIGEVLMKV